MGEKIILSCVDCGAKACDSIGKNHPKFCVSQQTEEKLREEVKQRYLLEENQKVMVASAEVEYENYCQMTRVQETIEWAKKIHAKKIGIATCVGLLSESRILAKILRNHGFEVYGVGCKVGEVSKGEIISYCQHRVAMLCYNAHMKSRERIIDYREIHYKNMSKR